jgi:hypothetical protein
MIFSTIILALGATAVPIQTTAIKQQIEVKAQVVSPVSQMPSGITSTGKEMPESAGKEVADEGKSSKHWYGGYGYGGFRRFGFGFGYPFRGYGYPGGFPWYAPQLPIPVPVPALGYSGFAAGLGYAGFK